MGKKGTSGKYFRIKCKKCKFISEDKPKNSNIPTNVPVPVKVMKAVFQTILGDITLKDFSECMLAMGLKAPSSEYFGNIVNIIFKEFKTVLDEILRKNRQEVFDYYLRNGIMPVNGKMNICVSGDGCYTRRSFMSIYASRFCIAFMIESWTGAVVDVTLVKKCLNKNCPKEIFSLTPCIDGNFHGCSKTLECSAVKSLYLRSDKPEFPFRYTVYVGDGDSNVHNSIITHTPPFYNGDYEIEKEECVFHYRKRCKTKLTDLFKNIKVSVLQVQARKAHEAENKANNTPNKPLDYTKLNNSNFNQVNPWRDYKEIYPVRFANLIFFVLRDAVKKMGNSRSDEAIQYMSNSIRSIPRHKMDHPGASVAQRNVYHQFCRGDFCEYKLLETDEQRANFQCKTKYEFWYEEFDQLNRPSTKAMDKIIEVFDSLATIEIMSKCTRWLNQNNNESIHHRLFSIISKSKSFEYDHISFAALLAAVIHNVGYESCIGQLHQAMGEYYNEEQRSLKQRDYDRKRNASENHQKKKKNSRYQFDHPLRDEGQPNYEPGHGFENIPIDGVLDLEEREEGISLDAANVVLNAPILNIAELEQGLIPVDEQLNIDLRE